MILCEIGANIGGMHICGNVTGYYHGSRGGAHEREHERCMSDKVFLARGAHWEQKQIHVMERLTESGVRIFCRHSAIGVYFDGNRVVGLQMWNGERKINIRAKIVIDATSDGHILRMTNVKAQYGRPIDNITVPFTVRTQYVLNMPDGHKSLRSNNDDSGNIDQYDKKDFSDKTIFAHANSARLIDEGEFVNLGLHTGVREGLTFEGEDCVRYSDIILRKIPEKTLFYAYSDLDRHGYDRALDEELFQDWWVVANLATVTARIAVPMGCIVPKGISGLVTAGRCLSCDTYSQSAVRMNRDMFRMGECVGVACAMAIKDNVDFLSIDYEKYVARVQELGCFAGYEDRVFGFDGNYGQYLNKMKTLGKTPDKKYEGLSEWDNIYAPVEFDIEKSFHLLKTNTPGVAIWSVFLSDNKKELSDRLYSEMEKTDDKDFKYNCAIALGIIRDERAHNVLREIIENRDCYYFADNRRSNQFRSVVAVCLLGKLGKKEDLPLLFELLTDKEYTRDIYHTLKSNYMYYPYNDRNFLYFDMFTHACASIVKIYKRNALPLCELHSFFVSLFEGDKIIKRITNTKKGEQTYNEIEGFIAYMLKATKET